jgi:hypothetical protein
MHRCEKAASAVGLVIWLFVSAVITVVACVVFLLPFLLMVVLDVIVGDRAEADPLTVAPPAPPQQPFAVSWARRAA